MQAAAAASAAAAAGGGGNPMFNASAMLCSYTAACHLYVLFCVAICTATGDLHLQCNGTGELMLPD
jgi:hypothetical protein